MLCAVLQGGITAIDLSPSSEDIIASAGRDHTVQIYDRSVKPPICTVARPFLFSYCPKPAVNSIWSEMDFTAGVSVVALTFACTAGRFCT